jgi:hypothetical protein
MLPHPAKILRVANTQIAIRPLVWRGYFPVRTSACVSRPPPPAVGTRFTPPPPVMAAPSSPPPPDSLGLLPDLGDAADFGEAWTGVPTEPPLGNLGSCCLMDPAPRPVCTSDGGLVDEAPDGGRLGRLTVGGFGTVTVILGGAGTRSTATAGQAAAANARHNKPTVRQLGMRSTANPIGIRLSCPTMFCQVDRVECREDKIAPVTAVPRWESPA